jgi:hypothetical protein
MSHENDALGKRKLLLDFYASQLTTHSRLIIGFSVILFTMVGIVQKVQENALAQNMSPFCIDPKSIASFSMVMASSILWYLVMRHVSYGVLANSVIHVPDPDEGSEANQSEESPLMPLTIMVRNHALKEKVLGLPSCLFISSGEKITFLHERFGTRGTLIIGQIVCLILGIITTFFFLKLIALI